MSMGRIAGEISDELERKFRLEVTRRLGGKKGDLTKALEEAIKLWLTKEE
jgi:hypothetical protein